MAGTAEIRDLEMVAYGEFRKYDMYSIGYFYIMTSFSIFGHH